MASQDLSGALQELGVYREDMIIPLGFLSMIIQAFVYSYIYSMGRFRDVGADTLPLMQRLVELAVALYGFISTRRSGPMLPTARVMPSGEKARART